MTEIPCFEQNANDVQRPRPSRPSMTEMQRKSSHFIQFMGPPFSFMIFAFSSYFNLNRFFIEGDIICNQ